MTTEPDANGPAARPAPESEPAPTAAPAPAAAPGPEPASQGWSQSSPPSPPPGPEQAPSFAAPPHSGWIQPGPPPLVPPPPPTLARRILQLAIWIVGVAIVAIFAVGNMKLRSGETSDAYATGYVLGSLFAPILIGLAVVFLIRRLRGSGGHRPITWAWTMPIAIAIVMLQVVGAGSRAGASSGGTPGATNPPAESYIRIASPYAMAPTTADDADMVAQLRTSVGQHGITDASAGRILREDKTLAGFVIVLVGGDFSSSPDEAMAGLVQSTTERSISPTFTTIDGRSTAVYPANGVWSASWFEGHFAVTVVAGDQDAVSVLAKAVLDAH